MQSQDSIFTKQCWWQKKHLHNSVLDKHKDRQGVAEHKTPIKDKTATLTERAQLRKWGHNQTVTWINDYATQCTNGSQA